MYVLPATTIMAQDEPCTQSTTQQLWPLRRMWSVKAHGVKSSRGPNMRGSNEFRPIIGNEVDIEALADPPSDNSEPQC